MNDFEADPTPARPGPPPLPPVLLGGGWPAGVPPLPGISDSWPHQQGVLGYAGPAQNRRPAVVLVLSILALVAVLVLLLGCLVEARTLWRFRGSTSGVSGFESIFRTLFRWTAMSSVAHAALAIWLLVAAIGSIRWAAWARRAALAYAASHLAWLVVYWVLYYAWFLPALDEALGSRNTLPSSYLIREVMTSALQAVLPILILVFYTRPPVRAAFGNRAPV